MTPAATTDRAAIEALAHKATDNDWEDALMWRADREGRFPRWLHRHRKECHALGLFAFDDTPKRTPLGRACLKRAKEQGHA